MHSLKVFVVIVVLMLGFLGVVTLFLPSKVTVSKSIRINASRSKVTSEIANFKNWKNWYPAFQNQSVAVAISKKGSSSLVTLADEHQRKLSMVMEMAGPEGIDISLIENNKKEVTYQFIFSPVKNGETQLTWNINTTFSWYPWKKIRGIFLDKITGPQYQQILENLKAAVEINQASVE
ncbi:MAG: SRPBCC family protein [Ginsengibacter sp.]